MDKRRAGMGLSLSAIVLYVCGSVALVKLPAFACGFCKIEGRKLAYTLDHAEYFFLLCSWVMGAVVSGFRSLNTAIGDSARIAFWSVGTGR